MPDYCRFCGLEEPFVKTGAPVTHAKYHEQVVAYESGDLFSLFVEEDIAQVWDEGCMAIDVMQTVVQVAKEGYEDQFALIS